MKLWEKDFNPNSEIEDFTVGEDYLLDQKLIKYDVMVNLAHAKMLGKIGILKVEEVDKILKVLDEIKSLDEKGEFKISKQQEDVHTAIEEFLIEKLGDLGKKIHTARSRNDQVMTDILLYCKDELKQSNQTINQLITLLKAFCKEHTGIPMPGYTHMQKAMPYSVDKWMGAFIEMLNDDLNAIDFAQTAIDKCPLGSAAGYGVPENTIKLDIKMTSDLLGFAKPFDNPLYVQNSRGKYEQIVLFALNQAMMTMNKLATDLLLFTTSEFNFFSLPDELCTGSSIMPQKKNYDVLELVKGKTKLVQAKMNEISLLSSNLPSGYNRDMQLAKEPLIQGIDISKSVLKIMILSIKNLKPNKTSLEKAMTSELYATEKALKLVKKGMPFREAYKAVSKDLK
ncbi:MAG: argininosuccinate lyase [Nanoarchaeota archaeon]|nr:argininosuccinate lyase [Nanoarchaeota archaeon]